VGGQQSVDSYINSGRGLSAILYGEPGVQRFAAQSTVSRAFSAAYQFPQVRESTCRPMDRVREAEAYGVDMDRVLL